MNPASFSAIKWRKIYRLLSLIVFVLPARALATPTQVILLRHGDNQSARNAYNLSPQGYERSILLGRLIPACFGVPTHIGVFGFNSAVAKNSASYQTAVPLAVATGVNIDIINGSGEHSRAVGQQVLHTKPYDGARAVFIWDNRKLPQLAKGLGWGAMTPIATNDYDKLVLISWSSSTSSPQVKLLSQTELIKQNCNQISQPTKLATSMESPSAGLQLNLPALLARTGKPPEKGEAMAADDIAVLHWLQRHRSPQLIANSWLLLDRNLNNFSLSLGVDMAKTTPALLRGLEPFLSIVDAAKENIKDIFKRPRPYEVDATIIPCLPKESGWSFPSGHSAYYRATAELLADLLPERRERLLHVGLMGGTSRNLCAVHYPSDVEAGQRLGEAAASQIIASDQWRRWKATASVQAELKMLRAVKQEILPIIVN